MNNETIDKVLSGLASREEAKNVACWFEHPQGSLDLVDRIDRDLNSEWDRYYVRPAAASSLSHWLVRAACALLIVIGTITGGLLGYVHYLQPQPVTDQVALAARGERTQVVLQDGTHIYLNSESQITFPSRFSLKERRIRLDGEAYFEVTKNAHRPFIVEMDQAEVTVLGTRFNARSYDNEPVLVTLDEGSVRFSAPNISDVMLKPGQQVYYDVQTALTKVDKAPKQSVGAWRNHRIDINNMPLADMIRMLERNYNVSFNVHGERCYRHSFTLSMDDQNLSDVLRRMDRVSPLSFKYNPRTHEVDVY